MTIEYTMILKYQLVIFVVNKLFVSGEWIEMPQFSDDSKVYKSSVHSHNFFYNKFSNNYHETPPDYNLKTVNQLLNEFGSTDRNTSGGTLSHDTKISVDSSVSATIEPTSLPAKSSDDYYNNDDIDDAVDTFAADLVSEELVPSDAETRTPAVSMTLEPPTDESIVLTSVTPILPEIKSRETFSDREDYNNQTVEGFGFQDYLPMEMLRKVHQTLKSQPSTLKGKIRFLKQFEKNLIAEIETRLSTALAPIRKTRGTRDYDNDEEMGFPSLEGALMAISFLTFAVYLVRLVMLLFRNANNTNTTAATIFVNTNRRSTDKLIYKTEEILNYLNSFETN